jgi:membrane fusion protein (multidrug efflux system)
LAESDPQFDAQVAPTSRLAVRLRRLAVFASVPLLLIAGAVTYYLLNADKVTTANAYVQQDKVAVSAQVTGEILTAHVHENQKVRAGDLLFRIDPEPYRIAIAQADATIASAQVRLVGLQTDLGNSGVDIDAAAEDVAFYRLQVQRQQELMQKGFTTRARLDEALHDVADAESKLAEAQADARSARAALATAPSAPGTNPAIAAALAQRRKAMLDLARSEVRAPVAGTVTQAERLLPGQMMIMGLPAVTIVVSDKSWVEANFKETDLARMRVGQTAELTFDAYPDVRLKGHVASIGAGTGSEFSILPAQNASGNWVKVTQRVPVRIAIDEKSPRQLIAGLSVHVTVDVGK